jgi:GDP-4-dehydro-6-deoxy-D-mannose reductase
LDGVAVQEELEKAKPDYIFHLAAKSHIGQSWLNPLDTLQTNISAQVNLLEAVRRLKLESRIAVAGSSEEYGALDPGHVPIGEETPLKPVSPYAVSKVAQDLMGLQYFKNYGMQIVRLRIFNLTGPGRSEAFVTSAFARQVARIEAGLQEPVVHVGNIKVIRDFTDVRDAAEAMRLALEKGEPGEVYNICSGTGIEVGEILNILKLESNQEFEVKHDGDRVRPSDLPVIYGNGARLRAATGWEPRISFAQSMKDLLDEWRTRVKSSA